MNKKTAFIICIKCLQLRIISPWYGSQTQLLKWCSESHSKSLE